MRSSQHFVSLSFRKRICVFAPSAILGSCPSQNRCWNLQSFSVHSLKRNQWFLFASLSNSFLATLFSQEKLPPTVNVTVYSEHSLCLQIAASAALHAQHSPVCPSLPPGKGERMQSGHSVQVSGVSGLLVIKGRDHRRLDWSAGDNKKGWESSAQSGALMRNSHLPKLLRPEGW